MAETQAYKMRCYDAETLFHEKKLCIHHVFEEVINSDEIYLNINNYRSFIYLFICTQKQAFYKISRENKKSCLQYEDMYTCQLSNSEK